MKLWAVVRPQDGQTIQQTFSSGPIFFSHPAYLAGALRNSRERGTGEMNQGEMGFLSRQPSLPAPSLLGMRAVFVMAFKAGKDNHQPLYDIPATP